MSKPIQKLLIANRGEIACRVMKTARRLGIPTVAIYSDADAQALHVRMADEAVHIGPAPAAESYIKLEAVLAAIEATGADAVHPGYGFLSERADFSKALAERGVAFVGPPPKAIEAMGDKITSKKIAAEAGVSTVPGFMGLIDTAEEAVKIAEDLGYPVMIKATAGGGGKGMRIAHDAQEVREGFTAAQNEARNAFGDDRIFIEKFIVSPRHIEIQLIADQYGNVVHLGERECSIQRRNQKVIEEAPSPFLDEATRAAMGEQACDLARAVGYTSAGTVEFVVDAERNFYFLEMNTRLQVEHPVTELVTGVDLVELMIRVAEGVPLPITQDEVTLKGWALESRVYAEDPYRSFLPSIGRLTRYRPPAEGQDLRGALVRNDTGVFEGGEISLYYDPMIAKLCTHASTREDAIGAMQRALDGFEIEGIAHNLPFLRALMGHARFQSGALTTAFIAEEYPEGFKGVALDAQTLADWASLAIHAQAAYEARLGAAPLEEAWVACLPDGQGFEGHAEVQTEWRVGETLMDAYVGGRAHRIQIARQSGGAWRLRGAGADLSFRVVSASLRPLLAHLPQRDEAASADALLSPMPGLLVALLVSEGDWVEEGQALATLEAMKMENSLRAPRRARIKAIRASVGESLAVDATILEFEDS